tara:strand:+ start:28958 stop:29383 length:426 start_codon:yes stop_codon:yes gene_type:complete
MAQEMITLNQAKGEHLELLKGLWSASHLKGKDLSILITDNALLLKTALNDLLFVNPTDEFEAVARAISRLQKAKEEGWEAQVIQLENDNQELIDARKNEIAEMKAALEVDLEIELKTIPQDLFPDEVTAHILFSLDSIIKK